jgi:Uma2 family endonuclease
MATVTILLTADDLWNLPSDGKRHELVKGELLTMPPAGFEHGSLESRLTTRLYVFVDGKRLGVVVCGDTGFVLERDPDTLRAPDIAFVRQERVVAKGITKKYWEGPPDLAIEIISPTDTYYEVDEKVEQWLEAGTELVWIVNPRRKTVTIHRKDQNPVVLKEADTLTGEPVLPGFSLPVREIFQ